MLCGGLTSSRQWSLLGLGSVRKITGGVMAAKRWGVELREGAGSRVGYEHCRVIQTARTENAINEAVERGLFPLLKPVIPSKDIHFMYGVAQDPVTGRMRVLGDVRQDLSELVIKFHLYYPYNFPSPFAAYLLPPDLVLGETVWLDDLIEDVVAIHGNQGYSPRLACGPALWNGSDFDLLFDSGKDAQHWIG